MPELADIFAYLYHTDLRTLQRFVQEAIRILRERENAARPAPLVSQTGCGEL